MQYLTIFDRIITARDCIFFNWFNTLEFYEMHVYNLGILLY